MRRTLLLVGTVLAVAIVLGVFWLGFLPGPAPHDLPPPVADPAGEPLALGVDVPFATLQIPDDSRNGVAPPAAVTLTGPWTAHGENPRGMKIHKTALPFRPRGMFFFRAQPGMAVRAADGTELKYQKGGRNAKPVWWHDTEALTMLMPGDRAPDEVFRSLTFEYPRATERERTLNWAFAKRDDLTQEEWVRSVTITEGWESRQGLLLPAPATASFDVTLPEAPVLTMAPGLVRPELADLGESDGCTLSVVVTPKGATAEQRSVVFSEPLSAGVFDVRRVDLSAWSGQEVTVTLETDPGATTLYDYCFVGEPIIASNDVNPRKVVVVFVDTLRPDHMSLHGYHRETTPSLDAFAKGAAVFENARSIAPWTLPSARTIVTGRQPELYDVAETLQARLAAAGFANGMIAGNVYLSANFGMTRDWDFHEVGMFPPANEVTDDAIAWLDDHAGQDAFLLVHYMSAHLPYLEPLSYRSMYAGIGPSGLEGEFHLQDVRKARLDADGKQYVRDRYDQCIRWVDDELARIYDRMDDNDVLVFLSDHGEEFWEHNGYEHGHTLYDELLRVPLVVKAPGVKPGRIDTPVSLLDVTPTILDVLDLPPIDDADGVSLVPLANGEPGVADALGERLHAFGRPLYGDERWGVLDGTMKYTTHTGREELYDLGSDAAEKQDLLVGDFERAAPFRDTLGTALQRSSGVGYRLHPSRGATRDAPLTATVHIPGGIEEGWKGEDPLQRSEVEVQRIDDETVSLTWLDGFGGTREAFVLPAIPVADATRTLSVRLEQGERRCVLRIPTNRPATPGQTRPALASARLAKGSFRITWSMAPAPPEGAQALAARDSEMDAALEAIGYTDRDEAPEAGPVDPAGAAPSEADAPTPTGEATADDPFADLPPC
jgi:hypothetical protein